MRQGDIMKYGTLLCAALVGFMVFTVAALAADTGVGRVSFHLVPGEATGHLRVADAIAADVPDRLKNARLSVICRPASAELAAAVEHALQKRFPAISLLDRKNLDAVLAEQGRRMEDYVNARTAPELQRVELAQAILFVDVTSTNLFWELSSGIVTAAVVDVETAVKVWQSAPVKILNIWAGYPIGLVIVVIVIAIPFRMAARRAAHLDRIEKLKDYNITRLCPRLKALQERLETLRRDLFKRKYTDEAREIHELNGRLDHLIDRAEILDTAVEKKSVPGASKAVFGSLSKAADRIASIEKTVAGLTGKIRENNLKNFDETINQMRAMADDLVSDLTHLEELK